MRIYGVGRSQLAALLLGASALVAPTVHAADGVATGDTSGKKIAFSNSYAGNSFRQIMIKNFETMAQSAVNKGVISGFTSVSANNNVTEQASQIQNLILQGYDAIIVLAGSDTALNGAIKDACDAGITVVAFASGVTEPCAYIVDYNLDSYAKAELDFIASKLGDKPANILEIRGMAGDGFDKRLHEGVEKALAAHPSYKSVGEVYGQWTATVAQKEVAGVLPPPPHGGGGVAPGGGGWGALPALHRGGGAPPGTPTGHPTDGRRVGPRRSSSWATDRTSCRPGRTRTRRPATRLSRLAPRPACRRWPSGSPSRSLPARRHRSSSRYRCSRCINLISMLG